MHKYTFKTQNAILFNEAKQLATKWIAQVKSEGEYWVLITYKKTDILARKWYVCEVRFVNNYTRIA